MKKDIQYWTEEMLKRHGWYAHFIPDDKSFPYMINIHTHGMSRYDHLDLQICFPMIEAEAYWVLTNIASRIRMGKKFTPGILYPDIIPFMNVEFAEAKEDGRVVLRVIIPDKYGAIRGECSEQWKGCRIYPTSN